MKKVISSFLVLATAVSFCACSGGSSTGATSQQQSEVTVTQSETTTEAATSQQQSEDTEIQNKITETEASEVEHQTVNFGDTISLDFAEIKIEKFGYGKGIKEKKGNTTSYFNQGHYMAYLKGKIKNLHTTYIKPKASNSYVTMIFDDKYTYTGSIYAMASSFDGVPALGSCGFYVYADVSEEVIKSFSTVKIIFGFTKNFENPEIYSFENFDKCDYIYELQATK